MKTTTIHLAIAALALAASGAQAADAVITSPDGRVALRIADNGSQFSISRRGEAVIAPSPLGLELDGPALGTLTLESRQDVAEDRVIPLVATKAASARDHYRGATLTFREAGAGRRLFIDARAYDDGVAFRYRLEDTGPVKLRGERTAFVPAGDPSCLVTHADGSHEQSFERLRISQLKPSVAYDVPVVCATPSGRTHYAITQANLKGYTGASLRQEGNALRLHLSGVPGRPGPAFVSPAGLTTAWRAVMMADQAGKLIESHLVGNLNPAPTGDFSWVKPGKAAWDWWSGPLVGMKADMGAYKRFIDFAAESGFPYYLIDVNWAWGPSGCCDAHPETDITRPAKGIDMAELARYAEAKGVGLLLWAHWVHVDARMDEVLDTYVRWGIKGVKVDFMNRDDQQVVDFYERIAAATAKRKLLLDLHGAYVPAGLQRTYPNYITQEGVLGAEWSKMSTRVTPSHNVTLPYTRMLVGPMDYTPGGFRNATAASFEVRAEMPLVHNTRGQALAMYVVYDSPLQMVSDDPSNYRGEPGFDFIKRVPTAWDETRFISGEPGRDIVLARRQGNTWYLGAMTGDQARTQKVPLGFLPPGNWRATIWQDGEVVREVRRTERKVTRKDVLNLSLAAAGGAAVVLEPAP
ncbi:MULTISPECIES: glycoside hydrolase family 97 protein [unclassified Roseateles]|uniref:glycoside hydrolase family 97 protein n=1 Tax=unclassified Roseateles TaxID=2626991 RepID=UPI0006FEFEE6|nr:MULTISPECIES: glycoside hydrolase family 97 protein [unclassified Roseateles]KQW43631.1 glycosyl hydrolase [Pelomonas sp. Root405]KRA71369.1 glycosyl hydrolase [Pelomonas sp. Root662]